jgi:hypothetical protein
MRGRYFLHTECADYTSFSCCLIRSKTQPIQKCSYRRSGARDDDARMTRSGCSGPPIEDRRASGCEHSAIGYVLLHIDNKERSLSNGEDSTDQT